MKRKIFSAFLALVLCFSLALTVSAEEYLIYDEADLLTEFEEAALEQELMDVSRRHSAQLVIATIPSADGEDVDVLLEYIYDSMGFGYGANHDGVFLLVCMDPREYRILSNGFAGRIIDSAVIADIGDAIVPDLSRGDYAAAFSGFARQCDAYLNGSAAEPSFDFGRQLLICLVIGIAAGLIVAFVLKGQLKTVYKQSRANAYVKPGSMQVTLRNDIFLYRNVLRTKRQTSSSSGSRSGSSRSTGGGKF